MISISFSGATARARSITVMLGILGTNTSPPCICSRQRITKRTPWSRVSQKRVMRSSVTVTRPFWRCLRNTGTTLPRLPTTLP